VQALLRLYLLREFYAIGLGISEHAVKETEENAKKLKVWNVDFVVASSDSSVFQPNSFDIIIVADTFENLPSGVLERTLMNCCYAWLRPGGALVIHTFPTLYYPSHLIKVPSFSCSSFFSLEPLFHFTYGL